VQGIDVTADVTDTSVNKTTRREYQDSQGRALIETWGVTGMDHGAAIDTANKCGTAAQYVLDVGVCSSFYIARFFGLTSGAQTDGGTPPPVDAGTVDAGKPDAGQVDAGKPDAGPVDAGKPDAGQVDAGQADGGSGGACVAVTDSTYNLVLQGKAVRCGTWSAYACAGSVQLGYWNVFVQATVHSNDSSTWLAGKCP
jgi:hypothetical protein